MTDREHREQTLRALLREVAHRSKNLLAIIQSIAAQTGRHADTVENFLTRFRGRLMSMASSQDLITSSNWRGAGFRDLVRAQIARYVADPSQAVRFAGPDLSLNPNAALHIGLAVHELVVNSVSYGGLANPKGTVDVAIRPVDEILSGAFSLEWRERIPEVGPAVRVKRFGSAALERVVPAALGGSADMRIDGEDLRYRLIVPATNVVPGG
jgi:two-component sensor histidine kinase